jgi:hypothetical protein
MLKPKEHVIPNKKINRFVFKKTFQEEREVKKTDRHSTEIKD